MIEKKTNKNKFHIEFLNPSQKFAWSAFQQHDVLFLSGVAGTGKSHLAVAFAVNEVLQNKKKKIVLTRPIVEAGESLGYLPGDMLEKVNPYMLPLFDCLSKMGGDLDKIKNAIEIAPLAYLRGRTFDDAVCILDEAQNATFPQMKLFLTRLGQNSKMIVTGDPLQSDLPPGDSAFSDTVRRFESLNGIAIVKFDKECIVRHPLIGKMLEKLEE
jgi:phosphate starvation-inducible PhoH-like protein